MTPDNIFGQAYQALESEMRTQAMHDGDVFLPNPAPEGRVDYAVICMEPSLGRWAATPQDATRRINAGFRNFLWSTEDFILQFCAKEYLCGDGERYHITDLSKGAMRVKAAGVRRVERYDRWYALLLKELDLVLRPGAPVIAVGRMVADHLRRRGFSRHTTTVMHYSGQAGAARKEGIRGREREFRRYAASLSIADLVQAAEALLGGPSTRPDLRAQILDRLSKSVLTESRRQLMFIYKTTFESLRGRRCVGGVAV